MLKGIATFFVTLCMSQSLLAQAARPMVEKIWVSQSQSWLTLEQFRAEIQAGDILVVGEQHATEASLGARVHQANQLRLMQELGGTHRISLGMEFFPYPAQRAVDLYLLGQLPEDDFLREVKWGGNTFSLYRPQVLEPLETGGRTLALNIPREISSKVGRGGPESLTPAEQSLLPPLWELGSAPYFERFSEVMAGHASEQQLTNYFWAQSLWDDTMAWKISQHRLSVTDDVLVVIVGEFHSEFGHGLPDRLERYSLEQVKTMIQSEVTEWTEKGLAAVVSPHMKYGARADYIWVYQLSPE